MPIVSNLLNLQFAKKEPYFLAAFFVYILTDELDSSLR